MRDFHVGRRGVRIACNSPKVAHLTSTLSVQYERTWRALMNVCGGRIAERLAPPMTTCRFLSKSRWTSSRCRFFRSLGLTGFRDVAFLYIYNFCVCICFYWGSKPLCFLDPCHKEKKNCPSSFAGCQRLWKYFFIFYKNILILLRSVSTSCFRDDSRKRTENSSAT